MSGERVRHLSGLWIPLIAFHGPLRAPAAALPPSMHALGDVGIRREVLALLCHGDAAELAVPQRLVLAVHAGQHRRGILRLPHAPGPRQGTRHHEEQAAAEGDCCRDRRELPGLLVHGNRGPVEVRGLAPIKFCAAPGVRNSLAKVCLHGSLQTVTCQCNVRSAGTSHTACSCEPRVKRKSAFANKSCIYYCFIPFILNAIECRCVKCLHTHISANQRRIGEFMQQMKDAVASMGRLRATPKHAEPSQNSSNRGVAAPSQERVAWAPAESFCTAPARDTRVSCVKRWRKKIIT